MVGAGARIVVVAGSTGRRSLQSSPDRPRPLRGRSARSRGRSSSPGRSTAASTPRRARSRSSRRRGASRQSRRPASWRRGSGRRRAREPRDRAPLRPRLIRSSRAGWRSAPADAVVLLELVDLRRTLLPEALRLRPTTLSATMPPSSTPSTPIQARPRVMPDDEAGVGDAADGVDGEHRDAAAGGDRASGAAVAARCRARLSGRRCGARARCRTRLRPRLRLRLRLRPRGRAESRRGGGGAHQPSSPRSSLTATRRWAEARARVVGDLAGARGDAAPGDQLGLGLEAAAADRELGRADAAAGAVGEEALDPAVLERVERDRGEAAAGREHLPGLGQRRVDRVELAVDGDPDRLEGALGGVAAAEPRRRRQPGRTASTSSAVVSSGRRATISRAIERAWRSSPKLRRISAIRASGHSLTTSLRRAPRRRVHPHVERRVERVGEAALPGVDLHRGDAEVEVGPCRARTPSAASSASAVGEVGADEPRLAGDLGGDLLEALVGGRVAVDRDQRARRGRSARRAGARGRRRRRCSRRPSPPARGSVSRITSAARTGTCSVGM